MMRSFPTLPLVLVLWLSAAPPVEAQSLDDLAFMAGCWSGPFPENGTIEEFYTDPSENLIVGTTRFLRAGRAVQFEFTRIEAVEGSVVLTPYPGGTRSPGVFTLTRLTPTEAVFEAPEHDFPKRIIYRQHADGSRTARIDGGADSPKATEWHMQPVPCPNS